jgi:hypothetical protein
MLLLLLASNVMCDSTMIRLPFVGRTSILSERRSSSRAAKAPTLIVWFVDAVAWEKPVVQAASSINHVITCFIGYKFETLKLDQYLVVVVKFLANQYNTMPKILSNWESKDKQLLREKQTAFPLLRF